MKLVEALKRRLREPLIRYDVGDIRRIQHKLASIFASPSRLRLEKSRSVSALTYYLGILGGWDDTMTAVNLVLVGGIVSFPSESVLLELVLMFSLFYLYGSRRALGFAINRLTTKRVFRAKEEDSAEALAGPIYGHFLYMTDYRSNPRSIPEYVNRNLARIKRIDRILDAASAAIKILYGVAIGSIAVFAYLPTLVLAEIFLGAFFSSITLFGASIFLFIEAERLRAEAPPVWRVEDVMAVTASKSEETEKEDAGPSDSVDE